MDGRSEIQTIVIPASPEMGSYNQLGLEDIARVEPGEEALIPPALQVVHPPERPESCPGAAKPTLMRRKKLLHPTRYCSTLICPSPRPGSSDGGSGCTRT